MAISTSWKELGILLAEAEIRTADAVTLDAYRWELLQASADLSTARHLIDHPTPGLDRTEAGLLESLETASADDIARFLRDVTPTRAEGE